MRHSHSVAVHAACSIPVMATIKIDPDGCGGGFRSAWARMHARVGGNELAAKLAAWASTPSEQDRLTPDPHKAACVLLPHTKPSRLRFDWKHSSWPTSRIHQTPFLYGRGGQKPFAPSCQQLASGWVWPRAWSCLGPLVNVACLHTLHFIVATENVFSSPHSAPRSSETHHGTSNGCGR